jgi:hypothetical protein
MPVPDRTAGGDMFVFQWKSFPRGLRGSCCLALLTTLALPCSARAAEYDPFQVPKAEVRASVKTIAIEPLFVAPGVPATPELRRSIEAMVQESVTRAGFGVVPPAEVDKVRRSVASRLGGVYDPITGQGEVRKIRTCDELIAAELARLHGADAVLTPLLGYQAVQPELDGVLGFFLPVSALGERLIWRGKEMTISDPKEYPQKIEAPSITVRIHDLSLADLYFIRSPIEWTKIYASRTWSVRKGGQFQRPDVIRQAVGRAFAPLQSLSAKSGSSPVAP